MPNRFSDHPMRESRLIVFRSLVLCALMVWLGGFAFYGAIVIPTAHHVLGTHLEVGFITQEVSNWLNYGGALASFLLLINLASADRSRTVLIGTLVVTWLAMCATQVALFVIHPHLDALMDPGQRTIIEREHFRALHRIYLLIASLQWGVGVAHVVALMADWRGRDLRQTP